MAPRKRKRGGTTAKAPPKPVARPIEYIEEYTVELLEQLKDPKAVLDLKTLQDVLSISAGACVGNRHKVESCENRPCCYRELFPEEGKNRVQGLWAKHAVSIELKKMDPCLQRREQDEPCGLLNMGQTCYVNGVLQILFAIHEFRKSVLQANSQNGEKVLLELQRLFVNMESSPGKCADPTELVEALDICPRTQEDGWEFLKILLERLPQQMGELLKGLLRYETVCRGCDARRICSDRQEDFLEILVPIENCSSLQEALLGVMDHDVEAWCDICQKQCTSQRCTQLVQLPRILLFSLMRAAFSNKAEKDRSSFSIPYNINMKLDVNGDVNSDGVMHDYELKGVLQHQGHGSTKGHYVAQVLHGKQWWEFNDEDVFRLNSSSSRRTIQNKPSTQTRETSLTDTANSDGFVSRDAYMLVYCMKSHNEEAMVPESNGILNSQQEDTVGCVAEVVPKRRRYESEYQYTVI